MNRLRVCCRIAPALVLALVLPACASGGPRVAATRVEPEPVRVAAPRTPPPASVEAPYNVGGMAEGDLDLARTAVERYVRLFQTGEGRTRFEGWLARRDLYASMILETLRIYDLPEELLYLALIESGYVPTARSPVGAVGMWQFMRPTALDVGLRVDEWVDERMDPVRSTRAAARYLSILHAELGSWPLALAAYNGGIGRVGRLVASTGESDFFRLASAGRLVEETATFVPKVVAASLIGSARPLPAEERTRYEEVPVGPATQLADVARAAGLEVQEVAGLNPHLLKGQTPPGEDYPVRLPAGSPAERVAARMGAGDGSRVSLNARGTEEDIRDFVTREIRAARDPSRPLAQPPAVITADARADAEMPSALLDRLAGALGSAQPARAADSEAQAEHRVLSGENMTGVARRYGVSVADLVRWNGMQQARGLVAGETIRVGPPPAPRHVVAEGENLTAIARRYGVSVEDVVRWNGIADPNRVRIGTSLRMGPAGS
jgi:membrane-bound lytic murein transglycosylase D